jgi:cyclopropane fatty-acyl-phospholipid synthase-like methyltransferase
MDKKLFFDKMARAYLKLLEKAQFNKPISILELGCGSGYMNLKIAERFPVQRIVAVDSNKKMLEVAKNTLKQFKGEKEFILGDFFKLNLKEEFDLVHSGGAVEHFEDQARQTLVKIHANYVKQGGCCIIYTPTPTKSYWFFRRLREWLRIWPFTDEWPVSEKILTQEMKLAGLTVLDSNYFWPHYLTEVGVIARK